MSFIEGHLSLSHAGSAWTKRWCKVDKNEFSWAAGEAAPPLGRLPLAAGGTVVPTADAHGLFRFNLYADGRTLECSALSEAELDGWLDFLVAETAVQKADKPPAPKAAPKPALKAKAAPKVPAAPAQKVTQKAVVAALIKEAIEMEEFEKCVKYRKFRSILDEIASAVADEDFEKCVELRAVKKKLETELPEIALKKKELELEAAGSPQAPPAAAAAAASAKSSGKVTDLDAIKNKLWSSKTSTPSAGVSALLDDLPSKSRSGFGRETTAANGSNGRTIAFKAWKAGDPSDTDSDSESLVKGGGGVRFADSAKDSDGGGRRKAEYQMRTTWSGGGNMLQEAERRRAEAKAAKKESKERKLAEQARIAAEEKAKARAKKAMQDREREAKWAKFAPKTDSKKDAKMLSWDGGFTKKKALEMSLSEDEDEEEQTSQATLDEREVLDESDDASLVKKKKKKKNAKKAAKKKKKPLTKAEKKKKKAAAKARAAMSSTWGGANQLAPLVHRAAEDRTKKRKKKKKKKKKAKEGESKTKDASGPRFKQEWSAQGSAFNSNTSSPKSALKKAPVKKETGGLSRAADAPDVAAARRVTEARSTADSTEDESTSKGGPAPKKKSSKMFGLFGK